MTGRPMVLANGYTPENLAPDEARMLVTTRYTTQRIDVDLPGARALRISLTRDPSGEPDSLTIETGWTDPWRPDPHRYVTVPGYRLDEIREALDALARSHE